MGGIRAPWLVRIEDEYAGVQGAGTLLSEEHVLTCAHVVEDARDADGRVRVRVQHHADDTYLASVVEDCWFPGVPDRRGDVGDVAVLELDRPVAGAPRARLRQTWAEQEPVVAFGFPAEVDNGQSAPAAVGSRDFTGERAELNPLAERRIRRGFSGAAAVAEDGTVLGVVASVMGGAAETAWMITVRTLQRYAGRIIDPHLTQRPSIDPRFTTPNQQVAQALDDAVAVALTRNLVGWLEEPGSGGMCAVGGGVTEELLSRLVGLTVFEYRSAAPARTVSGAPAGTLPRLGAVTAAVDATGKSAEQVAGRLAASLNLRRDAGPDLSEQLDALGSSVVVVVNAVDAATEPEDLYSRVLAPIAVLAPGMRVRLLLGYRAIPPDYLRSAVAARLGIPAQATKSVQPDQLGQRLDELAERVQMLRAAENRSRSLRDHAAVRVLGVPEARIMSAAALGVRIGVLRDVSAPEILADPQVRAWLPGELEACEHLADRALDRAEGLTAQVADLLGRRDRLRSRLGGCRARAMAHGLVEVLGEPYEKARQELYSGMCDLVVAQQLVEECCDAMRREIDRSGR